MSQERKNIIQQLKGWFESHVNLSTQQVAIEFDWALAPNYTPEDWLVILSSAKPNTLGFMRQVVADALHKSPEERNRDIEYLSSGGFSLSIGPQAEHRIQNRKQRDQLALNIFSLSEENLANLRAALNNLPEG